MSRFRTTRWSVVLAAGAGDEQASRRALEELCRTYWWPVYAFVRRGGLDAEAAADLTQGYFLSLLERRDLERMDPERGRFRSFLLAALRNYLAKQRVRAKTQKRGSGEQPLSLDLDFDADDADRRWVREPASEASPEQDFERRWAITLLDRVLRRLREEAEAADALERFDLLAPHLTGRGEAVPYREIGGRLGLSESAVKVAVHRLRKRFGELLRAEVAETVAGEEEVDDEIRSLLAAVASG
ncbi:MAG TPA: sigma-70 family RNA polymerase sigma factor [Thermoanaerobaculia bacterium]|nr:sigma-70 family RNA polymerase sigma factor [Thermoanaerobaculia bacterium]